MRYFSLINFITVKKPRIEGTQIPTKIPSNLNPLNHNVTEKRKEMKAKTTA